MDATPTQTGVVEVLDSDIRWLFGNAATARFYDVAPEALRGMSMRNLGVPGHVIQEWVQRGRECRETAARIRFECDMPRPEGSQRLSVTLAPVTTPPGEAPRVACIVTGVTALRLSSETEAAEQDRRFLAGLMRQIRVPDDPEQILNRTVASVGEYLGVSRCLFSEIHTDRDLVISHLDYCHDAPTCAGTYPLRKMGGGFLSELMDGRTVCIEDARSDPRTAGVYKSVYATIRVRAFIAAPLIRDGRLVAVFGVHSADAPRAWQPREVALIEQVLEQTWLIFDNARLLHAARQEIEERRRAEERMREMAGHLGLALNAARMETFTWDIEKDEIRRVAGPHGIDSQESFQTLAERAATIHPDDQTAFRSGLDEAMHTGLYDSVYRVSDGRGGWQWLLAKGQVHFAPDGRPQRLHGVRIDISDRKAAEDQLHDLSLRLRSHVENSPLAVVEFSADFTITRWSPEAERVFGWTAPEALGKGIWELPWIHPEDMDKVQAISEAMTSGERRRNVHPNRNVRKDGRVIWCEWYNSSLHDAEGRLDSILSLVLDVTERKEANQERERLMAELEESREQYRIMGETLPYGVWRCNPHGGAEYTSQSYLDLLDMTMEEMQEFGWTHRLPPNEVKPMLKRWLRCCETGEPWDGEHHVLGPDGKYHTVLTRGLPVRNEAGEITSWVGINLDIDDRKEAEEALKESEERERARAEELRAVLDTAPVAIWIAHDPECRQITGNLSADRIMRVERGGNVSRSAEPSEAAVVYRVMRNGVELKPEEMPAQAAALTGRPVPEMVLELHFNDGRIVHLMESAVPLFDAEGKVRGAVAAGADITHLKQAEEALRRQAEELTIADQAKSNFLAVLGHELRNPLNTISLASYVLSESATGGAVVERNLKALARQTQQMTRLVEDLLDASRISRGKLDLRTEPVDLVDAVRRAVDVARPAGESSDRTIRLDLPEVAIPLVADPVRLEQVLVNVVGNALKFTPVGGYIDVCVRTEDDEAVVMIRDDGMGIAPDVLPRIFGLFSQGDQHREGRTGLGIGLALSKELVEMHGGTITAESDGPGQGSTFTIRLPIGEP